ncbi:MAG: GAF domain-containing sensor histidine kinase [Ardenticatenaceae bacterium]|nr:GAF domain-containing sensor histidine kinase [Ardenticatenaceae bacterium]MCB9443991.1 GAF domain-containing sensor histidine kinase [Ardenticatenaceae bacterium]
MRERFAKLGVSRLARMVEISRILNSANNLDQLLTYIIREAAILTNTEAASILLLEPHSRDLYIVASSNAIPPQMANTPVPLNGSIAGAIIRANKPMFIPDVAKDPRWNKNVDKVIDFKTQAILGVPMRDVDRQPVGVLEAINKNGGEFTRQDAEMLTILADIAGVAVERARMDENLRRAYAELNDLDQLKTDFISIASHELRTPLTVILGYLSFLREEASPEMMKQFDTVLDAAVHLRTLIQDMLNFQYVDTGRESLNLARLDLAALVREVMAERDDTAVAKQQTVTINLPETELPIMADSSVIEVVLNNLFDNAVKFTPQEGHIEITVEARDEEVWVIVSDTGVGIPPDQYERIFKRFYQVEDPLDRHHEGMGLGLAIVKELVELHQGRVWVESEEGKGSTFFVALPVCE